jgi:hypothetical protein
MAPSPLESLTTELKLNLQKSLECVLTEIIQTNNGTIFFREAALLSAFRERLSVPPTPMPKAVANAYTGPCEAIHAPDLVQGFYETILRCARCISQDFKTCANVKAVDVGLRPLILSSLQLFTKYVSFRISLYLLCFFPETFLCGFFLFL